MLQLDWMLNASCSSHLFYIILFHNTASGKLEFHSKHRNIESFSIWSYERFCLLCLFEEEINSFYLRSKLNYRSGVMLESMWNSPSLELLLVSCDVAAIQLWAALVLHCPVLHDNFGCTAVSRRCWRPIRNMPVYFRIHRVWLLSTSMSIR